MTSTFETTGLMVGALPLNTMDFCEIFPTAPFPKATRWIPEDANWFFLMMVVERA
jgi:hypothetical protein